MTQKERAEAFLKELTNLSKKYDFEVTAEGSPPLLSDLKEGGWVEFGMGFFKREYEAHFDEVRGRK